MILNLINQTVELLEEQGVYNNFEGLDISLNESLYEYGFIYSEKNKVAIYINQFGKLDLLLDWSKDELVQSYKDCFDEWANLNEFLYFTRCNNWNELSSNVPNLVLSFNQYYGIENSVLFDPYNKGFNNINKIKELLNRYL